MWYLVILMTTFNNGAGAVVIPEKYPTEEACKNAGKYTYVCIKAPEVVSSLNGLTGACWIGSDSGIHCDRK